MLASIDVGGITDEHSSYPSAVITPGGTVYVSGQVSFDDDGAVVGDDAATQTRHSLTRLERVLREAGASLEDVVSATVYLSDASDAPAYNAEWRRAFGAHRPARATVVAALLDPRLLVEVQAVAVLSTSGRSTGSGS